MDYFKFCIKFGHKIILLPLLTILLLASLYAEDGIEKVAGELPPEFKDKEYLTLEESIKPNIVENFDFKDMDLQTVVETISKLTNKNFILSGNISGKITIIAPSKISVQEAYYAFLTALAMNGFGTVQQGKFIKILRQRDISKEPLKIYSGDYTPATDQYITRVYQLKYIGADSVTKQLRDLQPQNGKILAFQATNTLIMTGTGSAIKRVVDILKILDQPINQEKMIILPVKHAAAKDIKRVLDQIIKQKPKPGSLEREPPEVISNIIADDRTNSLIVQANQKGIDKIKDLLGRLDVEEPASSSSSIHVYYCKHAKAEDMANTLTSIANKNKNKGDPGKRAGARFDTTKATPAGGALDIGGEFGGEVVITADKSTNALVITASRNDYLLLFKVIEKLDVARRQVYVEAVILEVEVGGESGYGINWAILGNKAIFPMGFGAKSLAPFVINPLTAIQNVDPSKVFGFVGANQDAANRFTPNTLTTTIPGTGSTSTNTTVNYFDIMGMIEMIQSASNTNIVSTPQLMALDNEEASLEVSDNIQISRGTSISVNPGTTPSFNNYEYIKAGIKLKMTPQINAAAKKVRLKVNVEVSDFGSPKPDGRGPDKTERTTETTIVVPDNNTAIIGGLIKEKNGISEQKFPLLGDVLGWIPVVGWLFKRTANIHQKKNVMIFLTPKIIRNAKDLNEIANEKYDYREKVVEEELGGDEELETIRRLKGNLKRVREERINEEYEDEFEESDILEEMRKDAKKESRPVSLKKVTPTATSENENSVAGDETSKTVN